MVELELGPLRFGVVGAGRLGRVLSRALLAQGLTLVGVSSASEQGRRTAAHALQVPAFAEPFQVLDGVDVVILCVPDDAVADVAVELADAMRAQPGAAIAPRDGGPALRVVHTSGSVALAALEPLQQLGCDVLSVHPLQTITAASSPDSLRGAAAAITADDLAARTFGHALAHAVGMHPFDLSDAERPQYHAAAALAANFTVTLQAAARELAREAGMHDGVAAHAFAALARAAVDRAEREGPGEALTGPIARGDVGTVTAHLQALDAAGSRFASVYRTMAEATVRLAVECGRIDVPTAARLDAVLHAPVEQEGGT